MTTEEIIRKALSTCRRSITGRQKGGVITRMEVSTGATCVAAIDSSVPTACWSFDGRHQIRIGTKLASICTEATAASSAKMKKFVEVVIRHETEHGICTDRTATTVDILRSEKLPFAIWNLFEDARIEYASATRTDGDGAFRWVKYMDVPISSNEASTVFWAIKSNEAGIKVNDTAYVPAWLGTGRMYYPSKGREIGTRMIILDFYRRCIAATGSIDLIPLVREWVELFGSAIRPEYRDDMVHGETDPEAKVDTSSVDASAKEDIKSSNERPHDDWNTRGIKPDAGLIDRISRSMRSIVKNASPAKTRLANNGSRLHTASAMQGSERSFLNRSRKNGKRSVTMFVDMSGSMRNTWAVHGGREFVCAFKKLADENLINLNMVLSLGRHDSSGKTVPYSHQLDSKDSREWLGSLYPNGDMECLMGAMHRFKSSMLASTTSVVFTDSYLSDDDIDTKKYRDMGINAIAANIEPSTAYVDEARYRMNKHFARSVVATDAVELARRLIREILKD